MAIILRGVSNSLWRSTLSRKCRLLNLKIYPQMAVQFASLRDPLPDHKPVQYSSSKASKITIAEIFGFGSQGKKKSVLKRAVLGVVLCGLTIYIFFFYTESKYDELLNLDTESVKKASELLDLKLKLKYCIKNKLPTDALVAKIEELEKNNVKPSPFRI